MEAKDLRLGNYVKVPREDQSPFRIDEFEFLDENDCKIAKKQFIGENEVHPLTWYLKDIEPIELSEEWLLKFGFEKKSWKSQGIVIECFYYEKNGIIIYLIEKGFEIEIKQGDDQFNLFRVWNHVHQLQNLYFALTRSELELKNE